MASFVYCPTGLACTGCKYCEGLWEAAEGQSAGRYETPRVCECGASFNERSEYWAHRLEHEEAQVG